MAITQSFGLTALVGVGRGEAAAFVLKPLPLWRHPIPAMLVLYARSESEVARYARPLARHCLLRGRGGLVIGASGPIPGVSGRYVENLYPRFYRGGEPTAPTDLAYSELALI